MFKNSSNEYSFNTAGIANVRKGAFIVNCGNPKGSSNIAAFDLDHTLIRPIKGRFPDHSNPEDYVILTNQIAPRLQELESKGYKIVIFTSQSGKKFDKRIFSQKVKNIANDLGVNMQVYGCTEHGYCRKPSVGMWRLLTRNNDNLVIDLSQSFYVGDAYPGAFSDSDYKFALNVGVRFYTPEGYFQSEPVVYVGQLPVHPLNLAKGPAPVADPCQTPEMMILVGPPASGKSTFCKQFPDYVIACQDDLGTKAKVIRIVRQALAKGQSVIVDRKNEYISYRREFIEIAEERGVPIRVFWFDIPRQLSEHLSAYREIMTDKHIPSVVFNKYYSKTKGMEPPSKNESELIESVTKFGFVRSNTVNEQVFEYYLVGNRANE